MLGCCTWSCTVMDEVPHTIASVTQVFNEASSARVLGHIARAKVLYTEAASRFVQVSGAETFEALALRNANACEIGQ